MRPDSGFASIKCTASSNASELIKIETVNPMPASNPTALSCFQRTPLGTCARPICTAALANPMMPSGLPRTSPITIPQAIWLVRIFPTHRRKNSRLHWPEQRAAIPETKPNRSNARQPLRRGFSIVQSASKPPRRLFAPRASPLPIASRKSVDIRSRGPENHPATTVQSSAQEIPESHLRWSREFRSGGSATQKPTPSTK